MDAELTQVAGAAVTVLAPFTPYLIDMGKTAGKKLAETIAAKGGEAAWKKAQDLWGKVAKHWGDDPEIKGATMMVAAKPEEESYQTMLAKALATRLQEKPELAQEFIAVMGGRESIQQVLADRSSWIEDVTQQTTGGGTQVVKASEDSVIKGVRQIKL